MMYVGVSLVAAAKGVRIPLSQQVARMCDVSPASSMLFVKKKTRSVEKKFGVHTHKVLVFYEGRARISKHQVYMEQSRRHKSRNTGKRVTFSDVEELNLFDAK